MSDWLLRNYGPLFAALLGVLLVLIAGQDWLQPWVDRSDCGLLGFLLFGLGLFGLRFMVPSESRKETPVQVGALLRFDSEHYLVVKDPNVSTSHD